jgi:signal transduction histidine kinase
MADLSDDGVVTRHKPLDELVEDIVQRWRLPARISVEGDIHDLPETVLAVALVVIREALTNAAKHSGATNVTVRVMAHPEGLTVVVKDNGRGFTPGTIEHASRGAHLGTGLMRQRVAEVGGTIQISSAPGVGTKVVAFLPVSPPVGT